MRFHDDRIRYVAESRNTSEGSNHLVVVGFDVVRNVALSQTNRFQNGNELLRLLTNFNDVASLATVRTDVDADAVHGHVAVVHELAGSENGRNELGAIDDRVQTGLQKTDQVFRGVTLAAGGFSEDCTELLFAQVTVVALELLLGAQRTPKSDSLPLRR